MISYVFSQENTEEEVNVTGGFWIGGHISSRGWGFNMNYLRGKKDRDWHLIVGFDAFHLRDSRELRIESIFNNQGGRDFVFGKLNYFFVVSPTVGIYKDLFREKSGSMIDVSVAIQAGPALGILSPYYIEVARSSPGISAFNIRSVEPFDPEIHAYIDIIGRSGIFSEQLQPETEIGLSVRTFTLIDLTRSRKYISGLQAGIQADIFPEEVAILAPRDGVENRQAFISFTLGLVIGNRW